MKVDHRGLSIDKGLPNAAKADARKPILEAGKRITSEIVSVEGDEVLLKLGNSLIKARNASSEQLYSGMLAEFEVLRSDKALIEIRPVALSALSGEESDLAHLQKLAGELGVVDTGDNLKLLSKMIKLDYPVSRANFEALKLVQLQTARISEALLGDASFSEVPDAKAGEGLSSAGLLEVLSAQPKDIALKQPLLANLSLLAAEGAEVSSKLVKDGEGLIHLSRELGAQGSQTAANENSAPSVTAKEAVEYSVPEMSSESPLSETEPLAEDLDLELMKHIIKEYKVLASDENQFLSTLVSLSKQNIKPSMLNMVFVHSALKGELGLGEALFELEPEALEKLDPELRSAISNVKSKLLHFEDLEDLDADSLEEMAKSYEELMTKIEEGAKQSRLPRDVGMLAHHSQLTKDMQPLWQAVIMPMMTANKLEDLEIYIKKDGVSKSGDHARSDKLIYLSLKTANMDRIKIKIDYKPRSLKLHFFTKSKGVEKHIRSLVPKLEKSLKQRSDKQLSIHVNSEEADLNLIDFEIMSTKPLSKIDVRI